MNPRRAEDYIAHIIEAARLAGTYIDGMSRDDFLADPRTQQAVILNIIVIGEAAAKLFMNHPALIEEHPDIPWQGMKGMRNRMAHGYFDIDLNIVWDTVQMALPKLMQQMNAIHDKLGSGGGAGGID